jgi:hypothetical protein
MQRIYEILLKAVVDKCNALCYSIDCSTVISDFEQEVINAVITVLGSHITVNDRSYHWTQSMWQKIQELGSHNSLQKGLGQIIVFQNYR